MIQLALNSRPLTSFQREYLTTADRSADILLHLLNDILGEKDPVMIVRCNDLTRITLCLDFSKIEAGKLELLPVKAYLVQLILECMRFQSAKAFEKGLEFVCDISADFPQTAIVDTTRLQQVLNNLLSNAIK